MENNNIETEVRAIVAEVSEREPEEIKPDASFVNDLSIDSMMALEILALIEKKFKIVIPEESLPKIATLNQTIELVNDILAKKK